MNKAALRSLLLAGIAWLGAGCSSTPGYSFELTGRMVTITSEPTGADVFQKQPVGQADPYLGKTPLTDVTVMVLTHAKFEHLSPVAAQEIIANAGNFVFEARKEGYKPFRGSIGTKDGATVSYHIVLEPETAASPSAGGR